jgi:phospholipase C
MKSLLAAVLVLALPIALSDCGGGGGSSTPPGPQQSPTPTPPPSKIQHVVIIFQENRSPDDIFGAAGVPGADIRNYGYTSRGEKVQLQPFSLSAPYDVDHSHGAWLTAYAGGAMDGFDREKVTPNPTASPPPAFPQYGYVPLSEDQAYYQMAEQYTFADRMFQTNEGPSLPAHQYMLSGTSAVAANSSMYAAENPLYPVNDRLNCDGSVTSTIALIDINTGSENATRSPVCFDHPTLFDALDAKGVSYTYYAYTTGGLWNAPDAIYHIRFGNDWTHVVTPDTRIFNDITSGHLPAVSWVIPTSAASDHAGETDGTGPSWVASVVDAIGASQYWSSTAIFITWDDWGGWYDHVAPQRYNQYELGFRVPLIVVSPYAKRAYVSHVPHEFGSILHYIEEQFGLSSLGYTDARADDLSDCFDYTQTPAKFKPFATKYSASYFIHLPPSTTPLDY